MNWLQVVADWVGKLWPFVRIGPWERGVRYSYLPWPWAGVVVALLQPGTHRAVWWFEEVHEVSVVQQVYNLPTQSVTTNDDHTVTFSANITFEIADPILQQNTVHDFEASMQGAAMIHLAQRVRDWTWLELLANQKDLERSLKGTLTTRTKRWGVEIVDVGLTDLVRSKAHRFYGDPLIGFK